jgi:hypothetical protein
MSQVLAVDEFTGGVQVTGRQAVSAITCSRTLPQVVQVETGREEVRHPGRAGRQRGGGDDLVGQALSHAGTGSSTAAAEAFRGAPASRHQTELVRLDLLTGLTWRNQNRSDVQARCWTSPAQVQPVRQHGAAHVPLRQVLQDAQHVLALFGQVAHEVRGLVTRGGLRHGWHLSLWFARSSGIPQQTRLTPEP